MDRARLTIRDLVMVLFAACVILFVGPVYLDVVADATVGWPRHLQLLAQVVLPVSAVVLLSIVAGRATAGIR